MSGGSFDYFYLKMEEARDRIDFGGDTEYEQQLHDVLNELGEIMHAIEWWYSGDYSESQFISQCVQANKSIQTIAKAWDEQTRKILRLVEDIRLSTQSAKRPFKPDRSTQSAVTEEFKKDVNE